MKLLITFLLIFLSAIFLISLNTLSDESLTVIKKTKKCTIYRMPSGETVKVCKLKK